MRWYWLHPPQTRHSLIPDNTAGLRDGLSQGNTVMESVWDDTGFGMTGDIDMTLGKKYIQDMQWNI